MKITVFERDCGEGVNLISCEMNLMRSFDLFKWASLQATLVSFLFRIKIKLNMQFAKCSMDGFNVSFGVPIGFS